MAKAAEEGNATEEEVEKQGEEEEEEEEENICIMFCSVISGLVVPLWRKPTLPFSRAPHEVADWMSSAMEEGSSR